MEIIQKSKKDKLILVTKENHETPSKYEMPAPLPYEKRRGVVLPNGEINWLCPCLGGLPYGPCGFEFRQFFECIHKIQETDTETSASDSTKEPMSEKAQECFPKFAIMKECFNKFPKLYPPDEDESI